MGKKHTRAEQESALKNQQLENEMRERQLTGEVLKEDEEKYRTLINQSSCIVLEWDTEGNVLYLNPYGLEFFGFAPDEIVGRNVVGTIVAPVDSSGANLQRKMVEVQREPDKFYSSENENLRKNGEKVWVAWTNRGIYSPDGKLVKTISFGIDRSQQRAAEQQLQLQYQQLQKEIARRQEAEAKLLQSHAQLEERVIERTNELTLANKHLTVEIAERKQTEDALRESESRFRAVLAASGMSVDFLRLAHELVGIGSYVLNLRTKTLYISSEMSLVIGTGDAPIQMPLEEYRRRFYAPESYAPTSQTGNSAYAEGRPVQMDAHIIRADGRDIWVRTASVPRTDDAGDPVRLGMLRDITEAKKAEDALRTSERKYRELVENANAIIVRCLPDGRITFMNEFGQRFFGYTADELVGRNVIDTIVPETETSGRDLRGLLKEVGENPDRLESINEKVLRNGARVWVAWTNKVVLDEQGQAMEILSIGTDVTERKRSEDALRESESRFRSLIEQAPEAVSISRQGMTLYVNCKYLEMYGFQRADEIVGHPMYEQWAPDFRPTLEDRVQRRARGESVPSRYEGVAQRKDGSQFPVHIVVGSITLPDGSASLGFLSDITERKEAEKKIVEYVKQLEGTLETTLQAVSIMVEMRDPYTAGHERRVGIIAADIAREMGWSEEKCRRLQMIGLVHDIGKIAVPAEILTKPTRLSAIEFELVKTHAEKGYEILKDIKSEMPVGEIICQHHERMDGGGYPRGLKGDQIMLEARILAVADVLESMASHRPYRPALGIDVALKEIEGGRGTKFDEKVADILLKMIREQGYQLPE